NELEDSGRAAGVISGERVRGRRPKKVMLCWGLVIYCQVKLWVLSNIQKHLFLVINCSISLFQIFFTIAQPSHLTSLWRNRAHGKSLRL
ncbi:MAG: hypothetical protein ACI9Z9_001961, partial [Litorivivens sp.]